MLFLRAASASKFWPTMSLAGALAVQGCAGGVSSQNVAGYDGALARGDYHRAAQMATSAGQIGPDGASQNLLWSLDAGAAMVHDGDGARTIPVLDHAEAMMKTHELSTLDTSGQYRAKTYDGVMVNTYKAIAAMEVGNSALARTELLRADDRQKRAEEDFQKEASAIRSQASREGVDTRSALQAAKSDATYQQVMREMGQFGGYAPFVNPFATYLTGLYFLNTADRNPERARNAFSRVRATAGPSAVLNGDYDLATKREKFSPKTWVIFENGQGSTLSEYSLQVPIPIVGKRSGASVVRVAMPRLQENAPATRGLLVGDAGTPTSVVGNFDYVQRSEFERRYPSILALAVAEVAVKAVAQNLAAQEKSGFMLVAAQVASQVSSADTRSWSALPKEFQAARIEAPKNGQVRLRTAEGAEIGVATVPSDASSIVYVKAMRPGSRASIQVLRF